MARRSDRSSPRRRRLRWLAPLLITLAVLAPTAVALAFLKDGQAVLMGALAVGALAAVFAIQRWDEHRRWTDPIHRLSLQLAALAHDERQPLEPMNAPELSELLHSLRELKKAWLSLLSAVPPEYYRGLLRGELTGPQVLDSLTRSGMLDSVTARAGAGFDVTLSGEYTTDMVSRLEPKTWRWIESSPTEQEFLGWDLAHLRTMSFLDVVHHDDRARVEDQLREALVKGEIHGLVLRIKTAHGKAKAIELNVSARYGGERGVTHLRCHITDVTEKLRAERELKLRTRELTKLNEQLRQINRELEELKDRYRDLYQNAPAMYFSLDHVGRFVECNDTMLRTLGYGREALVGHSYARLLHPDKRAHFAERFAVFARQGSFETEGQWLKSDGETIDVWVSGSAILGRDGKLVTSRIVAQDITARHRLEAELKEKNERLARTNDELSRKNKEMDEFAYVVSHDLQEPLRTLIAFSDFLLKDYGNRLDPSGEEYVRHLVDASRRMRALIQALLTLSRAGKVTAELAPVNLDDVVEIVKADLAELIRSKGAEIRVHSPLPSVQGDRGRLGQLMANLIGNGLKYNRGSAPWIEVGAVPDGESAFVTVYVRDNGIGIDPQFHAKIFQLFRRLHTREEFEGTGAGLAICAKIVEAHGGRIWVESEPDRGATFYVRLRRASAGRPEQRDSLQHAR